MRIRTVKPQFWESETIACLEIPARVMFIACLNASDDKGRLLWNPHHLKSTAFRYDDEITYQEVEKWMDQIVSEGLVQKYIGGRKATPYGYITGFLEHQKINRPSKSFLPPPPSMNDSVNDSVNDSRTEKEKEGNGKVREMEVEKEKEKDAGNESVSFSSIESFDSEDRRAAFIGACVGIKPDEWSDQEKELFLKLNPSLDDCRLMKRFYDMKESEMQKGGTNYWLSKLSDLLTRWTMMKGRAIKRIEQCKASGGSGPAAIQQSTKAETAHQISLQVKQLEDLMLEHKERFFFNMQWDPPEKAAEYRSMKEKLEIHKRRLAGI